MSLYQTPMPCLRHPIVLSNACMPAVLLVRKQPPVAIYIRTSPFVPQHSWQYSNRCVAFITCNIQYESICTQRAPLTIILLECKVENRCLVLTKPTRGGGAQPSADTRYYKCKQTLRDDIAGASQNGLCVRSHEYTRQEEHRLTLSS